MQDDPVTCPKCFSHQIHANQRGWTLLTGFIGSGKIVITCLSCGHRFRPGDDRRPASYPVNIPVPDFDPAAGMSDRLIALVIIAATVALALLCFVATSCDKPAPPTSHLAEIEAEAAQERAARQAEDAESERKLAADMAAIDEEYRKRAEKRDQDAAERIKELQLKLDLERAKLRAIDARLRELQP